MIAAKQLAEWLSTLEPGALVAIDDGGLTICQVTSETGPHDETHAGPFLEIGGIPLDDDDDDQEPDAAELFNALPSPAATRYGSRAEELEHYFRGHGYTVRFDYPGEGFTLETLQGEPVEPVPEELSREVAELEQITTE
jgi:hypothetical protein